jgi:uncharacterized protein Usg
MATAEIFYHMPDHPGVLQSFVWQKLDCAPVSLWITRLLDFWRCEIESPLHSGRVASAALNCPAELRYAGEEFRLHWQGSACDRLGHEHPRQPCRPATSGLQVAASAIKGDIPRHKRIRVEADLR